MYTAVVAAQFKNYFTFLSERKEGEEYGVGPLCYYSWLGILCLCLCRVQELRFEGLKCGRVELGFYVRAFVFRGGMRREEESGCMGVLLLVTPSIERWAKRREGGGRRKKGRTPSFDVT